MAKKKVNTSSSVSTTVIVVLITGIIAGFVSGYLFARDRYTEKIEVISKMNMEKAVEIDDLQRHIEVLGAKVTTEE